VFERPRTGERAVLVRLGLGAQVDPEDLQEFRQLAVSAGALPVATLTGRRARPDSRYFLGSGKAEELRSIAQAHEADIILVDHALSPSQERNLEKLTERRVLDRNGLILDIFAQRARSFEGKLEVELAQLKHIGSRLVRGWTHLERFDIRSMLVVPLRWTGRLRGSVLLWREGSCQPFTDLDLVFAENVALRLGGAARRQAPGHWPPPTRLG